jgi:hypothetical protein
MNASPKGGYRSQLGVGAWHWGQLWGHLQIVIDIFII